MENLGKIIASAIAKERDEVLTNPGKEMQITFNIAGRAVVKKGRDYTQNHIASIPFDKLFAHAMSKLNGVTVESIVREVLANDIDSEVAKAQVQDAVKRIKGTGKKAMKGPVKVNAHELLVSNIEICENC